MKHKMFVIYDSKANAYMTPWFLHQDAMAQRAFSDCVNDQNHNFGKHPEDYTLFQIGQFDDQTAELNINEKPKTFGNGLTYIVQTKEQNDFFDETTNKLLEENRNTRSQRLIPTNNGEDT